MCKKNNHKTHFRPYRRVRPSGTVAERAVVVTLGDFPSLLALLGLHFGGLPGAVARESGQATGKSRTNPVVHDPAARVLDNILSARW